MSNKSEIALIVDAAATNMNGTEPGGTYTATQEDGHDLYPAASAVVQVIITATPAGTTPTLDVRIQHSADGVNWATLLDMTQITKTGTYPQNYVQAIPTATVCAFGRYLRLQYKVGGTDSPEWVVTSQIQAKE